MHCSRQYSPLQQERDHFVMPPGASAVERCLSSCVPFIHHLSGSKTAANFRQVTFKRNELQGDTPGKPCSTSSCAEIKLIMLLLVLIVVLIEL